MRRPRHREAICEFEAGDMPVTVAEDTNGCPAYGIESGKVGRPHSLDSGEGDKMKRRNLLCMQIF